MSEFQISAHQNALHHNKPYKPKSYIEVESRDDAPASVVVPEDGAVEYDGGLSVMCHRCYGRC